MVGYWPLALGNHGPVQTPHGAYATLSRCVSAKAPSHAAHQRQGPVARESSLGCHIFGRIAEQNIKGRIKKLPTKHLGVRGLCKNAGSIETTARGEAVRI